MFTLISKSKGINTNPTKHKLLSLTFRLARCTITSKTDDYQYIEKSEIPTMCFQLSLPRLTIPKLQMTCQRYINAQMPLLSQEELNRTNESVKDFVNNDGVAINRVLCELDRKNKHTSYISGPWFDMYLSDRRPLPLNFNPFLVFTTESDPNYNTQLIKATNLIISSLRFMKSLKANILRPEVYYLNSKSNTALFHTVTQLTPSHIRCYVAYLFKAFPLDMSQYHNLFSTTRIPQKGKDVIYQDDSSKHLVVMRKGHFYIFDVLDENENIYEPQQIASCLKSIIEDSRPPNEYPVGVLTTSDRDHWADIRSHLVNTGNKNILHKIDTAIFCMILDDEIIGDDTNKLIRTYLHSNATNRWFDKSFSLIVSKDGYAGVNFEHSWGDGVAVLRYFKDVKKDISEQPKFHPDNVNNLVQTSAVEKLQFSLDEKVKNAINTQKESYQKWTDQLLVNHIIYEGFGKNYCKESYMSPDAVIQLAFQLALYYLEGRMVPTYESCSTAIFKHGRTEAIRPCTVESKAFCVAINENHKTRHLKELMLRCGKIHNSLTKQAAIGQGFDRHLFALKLLSQQLGHKPAIFEDPAYKALNCNVLSTSTLSSEAVHIGGFGPVLSDGYGIGYMIQDNRLGAVVTSYKGVRDANEYVKSLERAFGTIHKILAHKL